MTNTITINYTKNVIAISKAFEKKASKFGSEEYKQLKEARTEFPSFRIEVIKPSKRKGSTVSGLTFEKMKTYIAKHDEDGSIMKEFISMTSKENEELKKVHYAQVRSWFFKQYPEIKDFHKKMKAV